MLLDVESSISESLKPLSRVVFSLMPAETADVADVLLFIIEFELEVVIAAPVVVVLLLVIVWLAVDVSDVTPPSAEDSRDSLNSGEENEPVNLRVVLNEGELFDIFLYTVIYIYICISILFILFNWQ